MPTITTGFCSIDKKFKAPKVKAQTGLATRLLLIPSYEAGCWLQQDLKILPSPAPFMGICALHCLGPRLGYPGFGRHIACESNSSHGHFVEFSKIHVSACGLFGPCTLVSCCLRLCWRGVILYAVVLFCELFLSVAGTTNPARRGSHGCSQERARPAAPWLRRDSLASSVSTNTDFRYREVCFRGLAAGPIRQHEVDNSLRSLHI